MIRNVIQGHHEREIIKTAPDMVVYIENMPYVFNQWVTDDQGKPISVNINEFITQISINTGVESMIPSCTITMNVPNHLRYMFQAPGGNRILNTMDEIQVFCKGYYMSPEGDSKYHRVFHGVISSVSASDSLGTMDVTLTCDGILKLLELMLISEAPSAGNLSGADCTPYIDQFGGRNPYGIMAAMFRMDLDSIGVLSQVHISQTGSDPKKIPEYMNALRSGQNLKWGPKLRRLAKLVRLYGLSSRDYYKEFKKDRFAFTRKSKAYKGNSTVETKPESKTLDSVTFGKIEEYLPSMGIGTLSLLNSRVINRLEKLRTVADGILFEVYQDLGGEIVVKPPLYNLDVTMIHEKDAQGNEIILDDELFEENNPFIIYSSEVESEHETEDQSQIRATRMTVQSVWDPALQMQGGEWARGVGVFCDVHLASKFGIRESGVKQLGFVPNSSHALFALAASELVKANRSYRTYTCTIPVRPEIKLGFPVYIAHHDMYAYPRTVSISYTRGGTATMTLNCDSIRKRPMHLKKVKVKQKDGTMVDQMVYKSTPNLVYKWVTLGSMQKPSEENPEVGRLATAPTEALPSEYAKLKAYTSDRLGTVAETKPDSAYACWVVQDGGKGTVGGFNKDYPHPKIDPKNRAIGEDGKPTTKGVNPTKNIICDNKYVNLCRTMLPYTDENGYELIGPFPNGRWIALDKAMEDVLQDGYITPPPESKVWTRVTDSGTAFVFAGIGAFQGSMVDSILSVADDLSNNKDSAWDKAQDSAFNTGADDPTSSETVEPYISSFQLNFDDPASPEAPSPFDFTPGIAKPFNAEQFKIKGAPTDAQKEQTFMEKVDSMLTGFHKWASEAGEGQSSSNRVNFRGRLGTLSNDIKFHPNEPSVGNSFLADRLSTGFSDYLNTAGASIFSSKKES